MDTRKHAYYLTIGDIQVVAKEIIERKLNDKELTMVIDKLRDKIQWHDAVEDVIFSEIQ
jgi:hypothetical protein